MRDTVESQVRDLLTDFETGRWGSLYGRALARSPLRRAVGKALKRSEKLRGSLGMKLAPEVALRLALALYLSDRKLHRYEPRRARECLKDAVRILSAGLRKHDPFRKPGVRARAHVSRLDGTIQPYIEEVGREALSSPERVPLVCHIHGYWIGMREGVNTRAPNANHRLDWALFSGIDKPRWPGLIFVQPCGRVNSFYRESGMVDVFEVIAKAEAEYGTDRDRRYLRGSSMGGYGTWHVGLLGADRFAAVNPICPPTRYRGHPLVVDEVEADWAEGGVRFASPVEYAENARNLPVISFQGGSDAVVPPDHSRAIFDRMNALHYNAVYEEHSARLHDGFDDRTPRAHQFMMQFERQHWPESVSLRTNRLRHGSLYWVAVEGLAGPHEMASVEARVVKMRGGRRRVEIDTSGVTRLAVTVPPMVSKAGKVALRIDGRAFALKGRHRDVLLFSGRGRSWVRAGDRPSGRVKRPGLSGPIGDCFCEPFTLVHGPSSRDDALRQFATLRPYGWAPSENRGELRGLPPCVRCDEVDEDAASRNLVLVGGPDEHPLVAKALAAARIRIGARSVTVGDRRYRAAEPGVAFVRPSPLDGDRYAVTVVGDLQATFAATPRIIPVLPDWIVFDADRPGEVVAGGYFSNSWRVK